MRVARFCWLDTTRGVWSASSANPLARFTQSTITTVDALRSEMDRVRELRYAFVIDEEEEGLSSVATGIHGQTGELLGVLTVAGPDAAAIRGGGDTR